LGGVIGVPAQTPSGAKKRLGDFTSDPSGLDG
jgi:hypothetical protein